MSLLNEEEERFIIDDDAKAEWAIRKIRELQSDSEKWKAHYAAQLKKITEANDQNIAYFQNLLQDYFGTLPTKDTKTMQKYVLPSAELVMMKPHDDFERDDDALLKYLQFSQEDDLINWKPSVKWADLKKRLKIVEDESGKRVIDTATGEYIDGVSVVQRDAEFKIRINE